MPTTGLPSATVYIWYPHGADIGHASMYIGNIDVGSQFDSFANGSSFSGKAHRKNDNYVSWWPRGSCADFDTYDASPAESLDDDERAEGAAAHVKYTLFGLDLAKMRTSWTAIRDKPNAHYTLHNKNCAEIVARVLRAGGAEAKMGAGATWFAHSSYWTPKKVAQMCNRLRDAGWATKDKWQCPAKHEVPKLMRFFGLR